MTQEIVAPSAGADLTTNIKDIDLQTVALAQFGDWRKDVQEVTKKLTGLVLDLSSAKGLADAKSLRQRLINVPLADARKASSGLKSKMAAVSKAVGAELEAIEDAYENAGQLITPQIEARDAEIAEERRIAAEKEEARQQAHRDNLNKLAGYANHARGLSSQRIESGIAIVEAIAIDRSAWEEFADRAEAQKAETLKIMRSELEQARASEAQRIEAERLAAERAQIERERAEIAAQRDALLRAEAEIKAKAEREAAETLRLEREAIIKADREEQAEKAKAEAEEIAAFNQEQVEKHAKNQREKEAEAVAESATTNEFWRRYSPADVATGFEWLNSHTSLGTIKPFADALSENNQEAVFFMLVSAIKTALEAKKCAA